MASDQSTTLPSLSTIAHAGLRASPGPRTPKVLRDASPRFSPRALTAAAAQADERRARQERESAEGRKQSPNPATEALGALRGQSSRLAPPREGSAAVATTSHGGSVASGATVARAEPMALDRPSVQSPLSSSGAASPTGGASSAFHKTNGEGSRPAAGSLKRDRTSDGRAGSQGPATPDFASRSEEQAANRAFTFPGPAPESPAAPGGREPLRGMSLPMPANMASPAPDAAKSPATGSGRKHKCPYCATDFTRHHNLKSHLLTHSHEKPFICATCQARFRRLHDLKRHTKLHTGERPHICPKCGRRFARGDALARHNKGNGGCAGRRASMGSFGGEDDDDDESLLDQSESGGAAAEAEDGMEGLQYTGRAARDVEATRDGGRPSEQPSPADQAPVAPGPSASEPTPTPTPTVAMDASTEPSAYRPGPYPHTYPPRSRVRADATRPPSLGLAPRGEAAGRPASPDRRASLSRSPKPASVLATAAGSGSTSTAAGAPSMYGQANITESPKPLSPGTSTTSHQLTSGEGAYLRGHRSPSLTEQFQQQHFGRKTAGRSSPPLGGVGLPPLSSPGSGSSRAPQLPSLTGLGRSEHRYSLPGQSSALSTNARSPGHGGVSSAGAFRTAGPNTLPTPGSARTASHGTGAGPSGSGDNSDMTAVWTYIRSLEDRVNELAAEVASLRGESNGSSSGRARPGSS